MEHERRIAANSKTIKENVFSATTYRGRWNRHDKQEKENMDRSRGFNEKCFNCGKTGHRKANCRSPAEKGDGRASTGPLTTSNGGRGLSPRTQDKTYYTSETSWMASTTTIADREGYQLTWVVDSGCSRHMTYSLDVLEDYHPLQVPITINIANRASIRATGEGSARLKVAINGTIRTVRLRDRKSVV